MPGTVTAEPDPAFARVGVRLGGFPDTPVTVYRLIGGVRREVRAANPVRPLGGTAFAYDYEVPLGVATRYEAHNGTSTITSTPVTVSTDRVWLKNPGRPGLNLPVRLAEIPARERPRRQVVFEPLGRSDPIVVSDVLSTARGRVRFVTLTDTEADSLLRSLDSTTVALLQIPGNRFASRYLVLGRTTEAPVAGKRWVQSTSWDTEWIEVAYPPGGQFGDLNSYAAVREAYPTYAALRAGEANYLDLLRGAGTQ